ncbi:MAG: DUF3348 family protein [Rubrivivax sp.]|nr:MAG: DUF3348 family protein [Rubrivivax sp.]
MARELRRIPLTGSAFIRSLVALNDVQSPASQDDFAQRVTQWFDWTHTFSLSAALSDAPEALNCAGAGPQSAANADEREFTRVRAALAKLIAESPPADEFAAHRRRYVACQQAMEAQIGPLRRRIRATLAAKSPAMAQLAKLDTVMEQVVGAQERVLLSTVASQLEPRFERLRRAHEAAQPEVQAGTPSDAQAGTQPRAPWLDTFLHDMRALLLAELDLRLQPVQGLLDANRPSPPDRHE